MSGRLTRLSAAARAKLAARRGDTLVETLAALLIAGLGAALLATMITASMNVSTASQQALAATYDAESSMVAAGGSGTVRIAIGEVGGDFKVDAYESTSSAHPFLRYEDASPRPEGSE